MKSSPKSMVGRWSMALQELDYTIAYVRGSENTVADAMSRLCANLNDLVIKVTQPPRAQNQITYRARFAAPSRSYQR